MSSQQASSNVEPQENRARNQQNQEQQGSLLGDMCRMMLIFIVIQNILGYFFSKGSQPPAAPENLNGERMISSQHLYNILKANEEFKFDVYLSFSHPYQFYKGTIQAEPSWSETNLYYNYSASNQRDINLTVPVSKSLKSNRTLWLHFQATLRNPFFRSDIDYNQVEDESVQGGTSLRVALQEEFIKINKSLPLVKYQPKQKIKKTKNLLDPYSDLPPIKEKEEVGEEAEVDNTFYPHFKKELYLYLIYDTAPYSAKNGIPPPQGNYYRIDPTTMTYDPIIYLSDFWLLKNDYILINDTLEELNLTLHYNTYSLNYFIFQTNFAEQHKTQKEWGLESGDMDDIKRMVLEADPILLGITMVVSVLHTIFEVMAFKSDISFWNTKDSMEGISVKTLYLQFFMSIIIFLYLLDNETSYMIILSSGFGIVLDVWKLKKASKVVKLEKFPYYWLEDKDSYAQTETKQFDEIAMKYMSYALYPIMIGYAIYSLLYNEHKGWYSFIINTLVGAIYTFGFIQMTPQLYINYRLKSVEHMPSKALFYRFLNTIIDDLFSFIITMPTMHRISCFRDDVIFVIYLYQRWIYRVDHTRGPYGEKQQQNEVKNDNQLQVENKIDKQPEQKNEVQQKEEGKEVDDQQVEQAQNKDKSSEEGNAIEKIQLKNKDEQDSGVINRKNKKKSKQEEQKIQNDEKQVDIQTKEQNKAKQD